MIVAAVNPFVGTAEHGHTYPGATTPFGMTQVSPDTPTQGWDGASGYYYADNVIRGFSFTHLPGVGRAGGLGDFLLIPTLGELQLNVGDPGKTPGYASKFSHDNEAATPGYYRVLLDDYKVTAELTETTRCGMQRYTFPDSDNSHVVLDLEHGIGSTIAESGLTIENATTLSGYRLSDGWGGRRASYFVMVFSRPFDSYGVEKDGARVAARPPSGMPNNYAYAATPPGSKPVNVNWKLPIRVAPGLEEAIDGWLPDFTVDAGSFNAKDVAVNTNVPNAAPEEIYQTERYGSDITYKYPVPKGATYTVRLHFAEIFSPQPGGRLENISLNGKVVLPKLDIAGEVGQNKALVKEFDNVAPDANGNIVIRVQADPSSKDQNSKISAIEIVKP